MDCGKNEMSYRTGRARSSARLTAGRVEHLSSLVSSPPSLSAAPIGLRCAIGGCKDLDQLLSKREGTEEQESLRVC